MRLINKFTLWYLLITLIFLGLGSFFISRSVQYEIRRSERNRLANFVRQSIRQLEQGAQPASIQSERLFINELSPDSKNIRLRIVDTVAWYSRDQGNEEVLKATASVQTAGKHYLITAYNFLPESHEISEGIINSLMWIFLFLLLFTLLFGRIISANLFKPLYRTLNVIQSFNLNQKEKLKFSTTSTKELKELNHFIEKMTSKAMDDYQSLKEFTENASHELQTPLAVIRGKLELLTESPIDEEQVKHIMAALDSIEKLSKINQSLLLLSKLENQEYDTSQSIDYSSIIQSSIELFRELIELKSIVLITEIERDFTLHLNPMLGEILFNNLLSNAIRHNFENGKIHILLTKSYLKVINTGNPPEAPTDQLFQRFKKSNQSNESIGLGLSIVKQICELHHFTVSYEYLNNSHALEIRF